MRSITLVLISSLLLVFPVTTFAGETVKSSGKQTLIVPNQPPGVKAPSVVIYTLSTCSHCKDAKEYLKNSNIPFIEREIGTDGEHMATLMKIYDSMGVPDQNRGVPLFVIDNRIRIQGFNKEKLQDALRDVAARSK